MIRKKRKKITPRKTHPPQKSKIPLGIDSAGSVSNNPTALSSTHYTDSTAQKKNNKKTCAASIQIEEKPKGSHACTTEGQPRLNHKKKEGKNLLHSFFNNNAL